MTTPFLACSLLLLISGALGGQYCRQYSLHSDDFKVYYCKGRCCGSLYSDDCCKKYRDNGSSSGRYGHNDSYEDEDDHDSHVRSYAIVGGVIGGVLGLIALVSITVCIIKSCTKKGAKGRVIKPQNQVFYTDIDKEAKKDPELALGPDYTPATDQAYPTNLAAYPGLPPYPGSGTEPVEPEKPTSPPPNYDTLSAVDSDPTAASEPSPAKDENNLPSAGN